MTTKILIIKMLVFFVMSISLYSCRDSRKFPDRPPLSQKKQGETTLEQTPSEELWKKTTPEQKIEPVEEEVREGRIFLADFIKQHMFTTSPIFQKELLRHPNRLNYLRDYYGKANSIFHHPIEGANTISFQNIYIDKGTSIRFSIGMFRNGAESLSSDGARFKIFVQGEENSLVFDDTVLPHEFEQWKAFSIDLSKYAKQSITLELRTDGLQNTFSDWAVWGSPRIVYSINKDYEKKALSSSKRYSALRKTYGGFPLTHGIKRIDRGWFTGAITTDIVLSDVTPQSVIRTEFFVIERSVRQSDDESLQVTVLSENDSPLATSSYKITDDVQNIVHEYHVKEDNRLPHSIRVTLDQNSPQIVFIKEPVQYLCRNKTDEALHKPNVILISLDTLRSDHLGIYGYSRDVSPHIDALAKEGFIFTNMHSNSNWTLPSHLSMFTSLYPSQHQATIKTQTSRGVYGPYKPPCYFIPQAFKEKGYLTFAFTGGGYVHSQYGFNKGFDYHLEDCWEFNEKTLLLLTSFVKEPQDIPFFLFFHTFEIHDYYKEKPLYKKYIQRSFQKSADASLLQLMDTRRLLRGPRFAPVRERILPVEGIQYSLNLYDGAIAYTDELLGRFFEELQRIGLYDTSWILLTSDHGEAFGEEHNSFPDASWRHGFTLYDDQIRIPLIIKPPADVKSKFGFRHTFEEAVELIDIPPTLVSILGAPLPDQFMGKNVLSFSEQQASEVSLPKFSEEPDKRLFCVIKDQYKLMMTYREGSLANDMKPISEQYTYELYNLQDDPGEKRNLKNSLKHRQVFDELTQILHQHIQKLYSDVFQDQITMGEKTRDVQKEQDLDPQFLQRLRDLGYLQ